MRKSQIYGQSPTKKKYGKSKYEENPEVKRKYKKKKYEENPETKREFEKIQIRGKS